MSTKAMSVPETNRPGGRTRHVTPALGLVIGVVYLTAAWVAGEPALGLGMFAVMAFTAALFEIGALRSETVRGLLDHKDERISAIDLRATAFSGFVLIIALLAGFVVEVARGQDGAPYSWLGAVAAVAYLSAIAFLARRG